MTVLNWTEQAEDLRYIEPNRIERDPGVNRFYDEYRAVAMAKNFDALRARAAGYVVSERADSSLIWLDGQHRGGAAKLVGLGDVPIPVTVMTGLSKAEEADWVLLFQEGRKNTPPREKHRLGIEAGRHEHAYVHAQCQLVGIKDDGQSQDGHLAAVAVAAAIVRKPGGEQAFTFALHTLLAAFGKTATALDGTLLRGTALFWQNYHGNVEPSDLVKKISKYKGGPAGILGAAKTVSETSGRPLYWSVASFLVGRYNTGRSSGRIDPL